MDILSSRIQNHITGYIKTYLQKYIKNFEDTKTNVSIWEGEGSLHHVELNAAAINDEAKASPVQLVSAHVEDVHLVIPWSKITSTPIRVILNRVEVTVKLKAASQVQPQGGPVRLEERKSKEESGGLVEKWTTSAAVNIGCECRDIRFIFVDGTLILNFHFDFLRTDAVDANWKHNFSGVNLTELTVRRIVDVRGVKMELRKDKELSKEPLLEVESFKVKISADLVSPWSFRLYALRTVYFCHRIKMTIQQFHFELMAHMMDVVARFEENQAIILKPKPGQLSVAPTTRRPSGAKKGWTNWALAKLAQNNYVKMDEKRPLVICVGCYVDIFVADIKLSESGLTRLEVLGGFLEVSKRDWLLETKFWNNVLTGAAGIYMVDIKRVNFSSDTSALFVSPSTRSKYQHLMDNLVCGGSAGSEHQKLWDLPDANLPYNPWETHLNIHTPSSLLQRGVVVVDVLEEEKYKGNKEGRKLIRVMLGALDVYHTKEPLLDLVDTSKALWDEAVKQHPLPKPEKQHHSGKSGKRCTLQYKCFVSGLTLLDEDCDTMF